VFDPSRTASKLLHVRVASADQPLLRLLDGQGTHQPQARLAIGEDLTTRDRLFISSL
jgi:hypothetical protein